MVLTLPLVPVTLSMKCFNAMQDSHIFELFTRRCTQQVGVLGSGLGLASDSDRA